MPTVQTYLNPQEHKRFRQKAEELSITPYQLAQDMIVHCLNDNRARSDITLKQKLRRLIKFFDSLP